MNTRQATDAAKKRIIYQKAKEFEERVAELFRLLGYSTTVDYQVDSLQFDIRLELAGPPLSIYVLVECKNTERPVSQKQVREFASKVNYAKQADTLPYQAIIVSLTGFVNNAHEVARRQLVNLLKFDELILSLVDFGPNIDSCIDAFSGTELERLYVEQNILLQSNLQGISDQPPKPNELTGTVLTWLETPAESFLALLGDFGVGKTSFCKRLVAELATNCRKRPGSSRIPVLIDLRASGSTTVTAENILTHHFQCLSSKTFNPQSFLHLNREGFLVVIFDGFDEIIAYSEPDRYLENLRQLLRLAEGRAKVILTCRTHYFRDQPEAVQYLTESSQVLSSPGATRLYEELRKRPGVEIGYVLEFKESQIREYLRKAIPTPEGQKLLYRQLEATYNLIDLAERPFLLEMIVKTLPKLDQDSKRDKITIVDLYEAYCESWFNHTDFRLTLTREHKVGLVEHLALKIWEAQDNKVHYSNLFDDCVSFFGDKPLQPQEKEKIDFEVRTALFLRRNDDGFYSFVHRSFLEFFIARRLRSGIEKGQSQCLNCSRLTSEVVFFLIQWPQAVQIPQFCGQILSRIFSSRVSENALLLLYYYARSQCCPLAGSGSKIEGSSETLTRIRDAFRRLRPGTLNLQEADLKDADLRGICLDGANLHSAVLDRVRLQEASVASAFLNGASLRTAQAQGADFRGTFFHGADLSQAQCLEAVFTGAEMHSAELSSIQVSAGALRSNSLYFASLADMDRLMAHGMRTLSGGSASWGDVEAIPLARRITVVYEGMSPKLVFSPASERISPNPPTGSAKLKLTYGQRAIWFQSNLAVSPSLFTESVTLKLEGTFELTALLQAVERIRATHDILRASITVTGGELTQEFPPHGAPHMPFIDLRPLPEQNRMEAVELFDRRRPLVSLSAATGPLFQITAWRTNERCHILRISMHQVVGDPLSLDFVTAELGNLYSGFLQEEVPVAVPPRWNFPEYVKLTLAQNEKSEVSALDYWKEKLASAPPMLELQTDRPRSANLEISTQWLEFHLSHYLSTALRTLASSLDSSLLEVLVSVLNLLLGRYANSTDIVVGMYVRETGNLSVEGAIGPLRELLPLRTTISRPHNFRRFLRQVQETIMEALALGHIPVGALIERLNPERLASATPLTQVTVTLKNMEPETSFGSDLEVSLLNREKSLSLYDLDFTFNTINEGIVVDLAFREDLFDATTILRLLRTYKTVLEQVTQDCDLGISNITWLSTEEFHQTVVEWNNTASPRLAKDNIYSLFFAQVRKSPEAAAISHKQVTWTYHQLALQAQYLATELQKAGVVEGSLVAVALERSPEMVATLLAVLQIGCGYVPLDPTYPRARLNFLLEDSDANVLVTDSLVLKDELAIPRQCRVLGLQSLNGKKASEELRVHKPRIIHPDQPAYMMYTSGSTGQPKGVLVTHRSAVNLLHSMASSPGVRSTDVMMASTSLAFDISVPEIFLPLSVGARVVLLDQKGWPDPAKILKQIAADGVTIFQAVPSLWRMLLVSGSEGGQRFGGLQKALCGGEAFSKDLAMALVNHGLEVWNLYGPTETTVWSIGHRVTHFESERVLPIGRPIENTRVYLLDGNGHLTPIGAQGEICISVVGLSSGYRGRPALTAERFLPNPFGDYGERLYRTGDLGSWRSDGAMEFLGRVDRQIKLRGYRMELGEIEAVLQTLPDLLEAAVVARDDEIGRKVLVAYVVPQNKESFDPEELKDFLASKLPTFMIPSVFIALENLPLSPNGKVDLRALPKHAATHFRLDQRYTAPRNSTETRLAQLWSEVLGLDRVGIHDNFFDLGGDSLLAIQLIARTELAFHKRISVIHLFSMPTIAGMAAELGLGGVE